MRTDFRRRSGAVLFLAPRTGSPTIYFGTLLVVVALGAFVPVVFGKETIGQLETVADEFPAQA